uniref:Uncharacterized protein n=1 Tax=Meloidogyne enterolobii TaxID=390850 RepID=A0A6V7UUG0_MELEN|nr:unnamed protein product [Meloidogyne enterolobii]
MDSMGNSTDNPSTLSYINFDISRPKYGMVVELDLNGKIIRSYHDPTGTVIQGVSQASDDGDFLYLGSFHADFIGKVPKKG